MKKGFLLNSKSVIRRFSREEKVSSLNCVKGVDFGKEVPIESKNLQEGNVSRSERGTTNCRVGRSKRIQAPRNCYVGSDGMTTIVELLQPHHQDQGKHKREPRIEDSISNPSLFRPP
ncbi:hypothetical protein CsSME_00025456 [Camellia sinensis var. sinensis]